MPDPVTGIIAGASIYGASRQADAAESAASQQAGASQAGIDEQRRQFDAMREILKPYVDAGIGGLGGMQRYADAGTPALKLQMDMAGLNGPEAQRAAIAGISSSPELQALTQQGEEALLQRASATGGLRGGNIQGALAQFRPAMLQEAIERQYGRLGGFTNMGLQTNQNIAQLGQASAAGVGAAGMNSANSIGQLLAQQGAAQAGGTLGSARAWQQVSNLPMQLYGMGAFRGMGAGTGGGWVGGQSEGGAFS